MLLRLYDALKPSFMPIYAYKCDACGHAKDVLQKMSDPQLTDCPACGQATFKKQLTAAGFQLKGTGWYVTDFREGGGKNSAPAVDAKSGDAPASTTVGNSASSESSSAGTAASSSAPVPAASGGAAASTSTSTPAALPASSV
jgi:putative FmdB family regulatory protein